jgi:membrane protease subunit (stomatin/prohibitin family)
MSGTSLALESLETVFNQDLNGDGVIGIPAPSRPGTIPQGSSVTVVNNDTFIFAQSARVSTVAVAGRADSGHQNAPSIDDHHSLQNTDAGQTLSLLMHDGLVTPSLSGNHESSAAMNFHLIDLHATHFIMG